MTKEEAMKIANNYSQKYYPNCDIVWYAGEQSKYHYFWMKNSKTAHYSGLGLAICISDNGSVSKIASGIEINEIRKSAFRLQQSQ